MAKIFLFLALCVIPAIVSAARPFSNPFSVQGKVFCDPCRAGFETSATTYVPENLVRDSLSFETGAKVRLECMDRVTMKLRYSIEGTTDSTGMYSIMVNEDHGDDVCDAVLVSSPNAGCRSLAPGRDRARVILTRFNGLASDNRLVNSLGFMKDEPMAGCTQLLHQYQELDD